MSSNNSSQTRSPHFWNRISLKSRLICLFVLIFGAYSVTFGFLAFRFLSTALQNEFDGALFNYAIDVADSVSLDPTGDLTVTNALVDHDKVYPFSLGTALILIRNSKGKVIERVGNLGDFSIPWETDLQNLKKGAEASYQTLDHLTDLPNPEAKTYRVISYPLDTSPRRQLFVQIAVPRTLLERQMGTWKFFLQIGLPLSLALATVMGFFLASRALRPIQSMIQKAGDIGASKLSERLPVPQARDEVQSLAMTLNQMLDRLDQSFQSQERFVADASHQLLTPLSIMKGELEQRLRVETIRETSSLLKSNLQEVEHLISLVKNLLVLARVDAGVASFSFREIFLEEIVLEAMTDVSRLAQAKEIKIKFDIDDNSSRSAIAGDPGLLEVLLGNLLENAIKYSPEKSSLQIWIQRIDGKISLFLQDQGPGVPSDNTEQIFDRFSRARNTSHVSGYGLGLAIAKKIAENHSASLTVENRKDRSGAIFELSF